jgi:tetratricopeptide (TPR) repeat protein
LNRFQPFILLWLLSSSVFCAPQEASSKGALTERAWRAFSSHDYAAAERDFRELTKVDPSSLVAYAYLGHALFRQEKYAEAIAPYEKAHELEQSGSKLSETDHHVLVDQLVMAYGLGGQLNKVYRLLDEAVKQDPAYPMNYYNLACAYAEDNEKSKMLANLALAFQHKEHMLKGEQIPDPRADSSFQKYVSDPDFVNLVNKLGYK